jgi:hypothetical protein
MKNFSPEVIERIFQLFLRTIGSASLLAVIFVGAPYSWMNNIHQLFGMGELPSQPVVGYLARSTSAFYAILGGLLWLISFDLSRYRLVLTYLGFVFLLFGGAISIIDWGEGMPYFWKIIEGPCDILFGILILLFLRYIKSKKLSNL